VAISIEQFAKELRAFPERGVVTKELRKELRKPLPAVRRAIKRRALDTLPKSGGLNAWAASTRITAKITINGKTVRVTLRGARNSVGGQSDLRALDRGRVRHPSWGRRGKGQWYTQTVTPGFFTEPATEFDEYREACLAALTRALEQIRG
jgi:hypothetical protein